MTCHFSRSKIQIHGISYKMASTATACLIARNLADLAAFRAGLGASDHKSGGDEGEDGELHFQDFGAVRRFRLKVGSCFEW